MILDRSMSKPLFQPTFLEDIQVEVKHQWVAKHAPDESISISLCKVTYYHIFQSFKTFGDDVNSARKKEFTQKIMLNIHNVNLLNFDQRERLFKKTLLLKK